MKRDKKENESYMVTPVPLIEGKFNELVSPLAVWVANNTRFNKGEKFKQESLYWSSSSVPYWKIISHFNSVLKKWIA